MEILKNENNRLKNELDKQTQIYKDEINKIKRSINNQNEGNKQEQKIYMPPDEEMTLDQLREAIDLEWHPEGFLNSEIKVGNPVMAGDEMIKVVVVEPEDKGMDRSVQRLYRDRFPELTDLSADFEILEQITVTKAGANKSTRKIILTKYDETLESVWNMLCQVKRTGKCVGDSHTPPREMER
ncbi:hypothetical protein ABEB36_004760 [Hypothenemus hampei]|uniref:Uncharacterized protein n=1 Tax=Hypothenemus hampei TaxID=57062 RepID=A0ABD1EVQ8_HYPHA